MPKGPQGQKRSAESVGCAVHVAKIATGEIKDTAYKMPNKARAGARARTNSLTAGERSALARAAATARWGRQ